VPYAYEVSFVPIAAIALSFTCILVFGIAHSVANALQKRRQKSGLKLNGGEEEEDLAKPQSHVEALGGKVIFSFRVARLVACIVLLSLSAVTLTHDELWYRDIGRKTKLLRVGITGSYAYSTFLALGSIATGPARAKRSIRHLTFVLAAVLVTLGYRDLWPLATFTQSPVDLDGTPLLWIELAVLALAAFVIPLVVPRQYIPHDPKDPAPEPNPEQTASAWSLMIYTFLDPTIFLAYRIPHLSIDQLPPMSDYDRTKNLVARSFKHLDPLVVGKRHLFFGLMATFKWDYFVLGLMICIRVVATFASPLGINRLLTYLETGGEDAFVRPWFWIVWLLLGPIIGSITIQWYIYVVLGITVRVQGIMTQLIFNHALRIRVKAETQKLPAASAASTAAQTPDIASIAEASEGSPSEEETTGSARSSAAASKGKQREQSSVSMSSTSTKVDKEQLDDSQDTNLAGRLNNLATADMELLVNGRDFLFVILHTPIQLILCVVFLYKILGWSAFVGLGATVVMFPLPGYIASLIQKTQIIKMKKAYIVF